MPGPTPQVAVIIIYCDINVCMTLYVTVMGLRTRVLL